MEQHRRPMSEIAHCIEVLHHCIAKSRQFWPAVHGLANRWVNEVEDLFMVPNTFGELPIEPAKRVLFGAPNSSAGRTGSIEEPPGLAPCVGDDRIKTVTDEEEESVVTTRSVEILPCSGTGIGNVDDRNGGHIPLWPVARRCA